MPDLSEPAFDVIVVGGGSAGVVVAARLSEIESLKVLLVEAGEDYPPGGEPAAVRDTFHTAVYRAENMWPGLLVHWRAGQGANGEPLAPRRYEQARIMGGGSSVNAMAAIRGLPGDYDEWDRQGARGWAWNQCLPYFIKLENDLDFAGPLHGKSGPIPIRRNPRNNWPPFSSAVASVLEGQGYRFIPDLNGEFGEGICATPVSSLPAHRVSTARGYLTAAVRARPNLTIMARVTVVDVLLRGTVAVGVRIRGADGELREVTARQVILSAGALHTPALLLRAGIGDADHLGKIGIPVVSHRPGVGQNLQDHPAVAVGLHLKRGAMQKGGWRPAPSVSLRFSSGVPGCASSDCWLSIANKTSWHPLGRRIAALGISIYNPYSRGQVRLNSASPLDEPHIEFRMLSDDRDLARMKLGLRKICDLARHPEIGRLVNAVFLASFSERVRDLNRYSKRSWVRSWIGTTALDGPAMLRRWLIANVVAPGGELASVYDDERELTAWLLRSATGFYHPVGTCKMGAPDDPDAVADSEGKVYGVNSLRVVDASLMPAIVRANTNIPTIMMAEKIADSIKSRLATVGG